MVSLSPMNAEEFSTYLPHLVDSYAGDLSRNLGVSIEAARERSAKQTSELLPQGAGTPDHLLYLVRDEAGQHAGYLWLFVDKPNGSAFVYDIELFAEFRGRGLGKAAMLAAEEVVRGLGIYRLGLHVFGDNPVAIHLYQSLGYEVIGMNMQKKI